MIKDNKRKTKEKGRSRKKAKADVTGIVMFLVLALGGLSFLLYPTVSNWWNRIHEAKAIASYSDVASGLSAEECDRLWAMAEEYNRNIKKRSNIFDQKEEELERYKQCLDIDGSGIMGYIDIPSIKVQLPIYHGTDDGVLQVAVGHIEWTYLPIGGGGCHSVISGHRGLPQASLFTKLDKIEMGDIFTLYILNRTLEYKVDQILTVLPDDTDALMPFKGEDYCTLVTCTPYGINTHRLLVRGKRVEKID